MVISRESRQLVTWCLLHIRKRCLIAYCLLFLVLAFAFICHHTNKKKKTLKKKKTTQNMAISNRLLSLAFLSLMVSCAFGEKIKGVTYDGRSMIVNGERQLLFSGSIHYPRMPPQVTSIYLV